MTVIADVSVPADQLPLGESLTTHPAVTIELETIVPVGNTHLPFIWVDDHDLDGVEEAIRADDAVESTTVIETLDGRALLKVEWTAGSFPLADPLRGSDGAIIEGIGSGDSFRFTLRFPDKNGLSEFFEACRDSGCPLHLDRLHDPTGSPDVEIASSLTDIQRSTLQVAFEMGYFSVPRQSNLLEIADEIGVSDTAASQRIRRGLSGIFSALFGTEES